MFNNTPDALDNSGVVGYIAGVCIFDSTELPSEVFGCKERPPEVFGCGVVESPPDTGEAEDARRVTMR